MSHPLSPKRTSTSVNSNKRLNSSGKSPGFIKKKRLASANNVPTTVNHANDETMHDTTGQNKNLPSLDEITFFDKVIL